MVFSDENKILTKNLHQSKGYEATELINKFPNKLWTISSTNRLLTKFRDTDAVNRLAGSGRPRSARTKENVQWLMIWFWVKKIRRRLTERSVTF